MRYLLIEILDKSGRRMPLFLLLLVLQLLHTFWGSWAITVGGSNSEKPEEIYLEGTSVSLAEILAALPMGSIFDNKRVTYPQKEGIFPPNRFKSGHHNFLDFVLAHSRPNRRWGSSKSRIKRCTPLKRTKPGFLAWLWGFILPKKKETGILCVEDLLAAFAEGGTGGSSKSESRALDNINININNIPQTVTYSKTTTSTTTTTTTTVEPTTTEEPKLSWTSLESYLKKMKLIHDPFQSGSINITTDPPPNSSFPAHLNMPKPFDYKQFEPSKQVNHLSNVSSSQKLPSSTKGRFPINQNSNQNNGQWKPYFQKKPTHGHFPVYNNEILPMESPTLKIRSVLEPWLPILYRPLKGHPLFHRRRPKPGSPFPNGPRPMVLRPPPNDHQPENPSFQNNFPNGPEFMPNPINENWHMRKPSFSHDMNRFPIPEGHEGSFFNPSVHMDSPSFPNDVSRFPSGRPIEAHSPPYNNFSPLESYNDIPTPAENGFQTPPAESFKPSPEIPPDFNNFPPEQSFPNPQSNTLFEDFPPSAGESGLGGEYPSVPELSELPPPQWMDLLELFQDKENITNINELNKPPSLGNMDETVKNFNPNTTNITNTRDDDDIFKLRNSLLAKLGNKMIVKGNTPSSSSSIGYSTLFKIPNPDVQQSSVIDSMDALEIESQSPTQITTSVDLKNTETTTVTVIESQSSQGINLDQKIQTENTTDFLTALLL